MSTLNSCSGDKETHKHLFLKPKVFPHCAPLGDLLTCCSACFFLFRFLLQSLSISTFSSSSSPALIFFDTVRARRSKTVSNMSSRHRCYFFLPNFRFLGRYLQLLLLLLLFLVPERGTCFFLQQSSKSSSSSSSSFGAVEGSCISSQDDIEYFFALKTNASYWKWIKPNGKWL